jgi:hypothetical protein
MKQGDYVRINGDWPVWGIVQDIALGEEPLVAVEVGCHGRIVNIAPDQLVIQTYEQQQREIRREHMKSCVSYSEYKDKACAGCVIHWMAVYECRWYDTIQIGKGEVFLWGKLIAKVTWDGIQPIFEWQDTPDDYLNKNIAFWAENQEIWLNQ